MRFARPVLAFIVLAAAAGVSCGGSDDGARVTVMVSGDPEEIAAYEAVVDAFNARPGATEVDLIPVADREEMILRLSTSIAGGRPPDLFLMNYRYFGQFAARGALDPLGAFLERSSTFASDDFFETAMAPFRWGGEQMCLPQNVSSLVVYVNVDRFRDAGLTPPGSGWTWDDMVTAARRLTRDVDGDGTVEVHGVGIDPELIRLAPIVWSNGGTVVDDDVAPTGFTFDARAVLAIERLLDLRIPLGVTPTDEDAEAEDLESRFLNGRLAMLFESRRVVPTLRTIERFTWDVAPLPILREPVSILHSDAYCLTAASDDAAAAWRFVEFALGPEGQRITARTGRTVPSLRSVAASDAFLDPDAAPMHSEVFLEQIPTLRSVPAISTWPEIEDLANDILEEAYYTGGAALEVALEIDAATREAFARAER